MVSGRASPGDERGCRADVLNRECLGLATGERLEITRTDINRAKDTKRRRDLEAWNREAGRCRSSGRRSERNYDGSKKSELFHAPPPTGWPTLSQGLTPAYGRSSRATIPHSTGRGAAWLAR